jgi:hypothetical protein
MVDAPTPELQTERASWHPNPADLSSFDNLFTPRQGNFDIVPEVSGIYNTSKQQVVLPHIMGYSIWVAHVDELLAELTILGR